MLILQNIIFFLFPLIIQSLICPVYNVFNNETSTINSCDKNSSLCTYISTQSTHRRCLGIYTFDNNLKTKENLIRVRQLALVDDFEDKYFNNTDCILDVDKTGSNLLCQCNSNNCTLIWQTATNLNQKFYQKITNRIQEYSNWCLPLTITLFIIIIIFICILIFIAIMKYYYYKRRKEKGDQSYLATISSASTNISNIEIDEFLSSNPTYQSIISHGKSSIIYRAWTTGKGNIQHDKKLVAVKVYHEQQYKNLFENEVQILRMIHHSSIIK
jgi:hypothetical protein